MDPHPLIVQLATERRALGVSQVLLGEKAGLHRQTIAEYETGARDPRLSSLELLAESLGYCIALVPFRSDRACRVCGHEKPRRDFPQDRRRPDGRATYCLACKAEGVAVTSQRGDHRTGRGFTNEARIIARADRQKTYAEFRDSGKSPDEAAKAAGLATPRSRQRYELAYRNRTEAAA